MLNKMINGYMRFMANKTLKKYRFYPATKTALILPDVQSAFLDKAGSGWNSIKEVSSSNTLHKKLEELVTFCREKGIVIFYVPYNPIESEHLSPIQKQMNKAVANYASYFQDLSPRSLAPNNNETVIEDRSGLSVFSSSALKKGLKNFEIEHILLAGPLTNISIDSSARDGIETDYHVTIIEDCCSGFLEDEYKTAIKTTLPRVTHNIEKLENFKTFASNS